MENFYNIKRLALVFAIQAEIEGMKTRNEDKSSAEPFNEHDFYAKAEELRRLAYAHNEQL